MNGQKISWQTHCHKNQSIFRNSSLKSVQSVTIVTSTFFRDLPSYRTVHMLVISVRQNYALTLRLIHCAYSSAISTEVFEISTSKLTSNERDKIVNILIPFIWFIDDIFDNIFKEDSLTR